MTRCRADPKHTDTATGHKVRASVIVAVHNGQATIERCLAALVQQTMPREHYEIIVVDDGSTDDTRAQVKSFDEIKLLLQHQAGPASARNLGAQRARGEILLFTDADCEPAPDWIEQMVAPFAKVQVVGVKGIYRTRQRALVARFVQLEYETRYEHMARHMARSGRIDFVDTYAAGYRRTVFLENGGFDPAFATASVEDQEFSFRLAMQGHRMVFVPQAAVYHWGHAGNLWAYACKKFKIAYFKVEVLARHHTKAWNDAHTPQRLKAQILLLGLGGCCLVAGLFWRTLIWVAVGLGSLFVLITLPFAIKAWTKDKPVAIVSPFLLFLRALALGCGLTAGILGYLGKKAAQLVSR